MLIATCLGALVSTPLCAQESQAPQVIESTGEPVTLVELYSSEGCSSCPPAEESINRFTSDSRLWKQIVPVVFHVDYWDGLGWPDRFARKAFTQRQYDYAARLGSDSVYTPEFIVQGAEWRNRILGLPLNSTPPQGKLRLVATGPVSGVQATYTPASGAKADDGQLTLHLAWLGLGIYTDVQRGENAGTKLRHDFVVLDFQSKSISRTDSIQFSAPQLPTQDRPGALAAWITNADGNIVLVAGGPLAK